MGSKTKEELLDTITSKPMIPSELFQENDIQRSIRQSKAVHDEIMKDYKAFYDAMYIRIAEELIKVEDELVDKEISIVPILPDTNHYPEKCPVCGSKNFIDHESFDNNGVIGPGYKSWVIDKYIGCKDCGVRFGNIK